MSNKPFPEFKLIDDFTKLATNALYTLFDAKKEIDSMLQKNLQDAFNTIDEATKEQFKVLKEIGNRFNIEQESFQNQARSFFENFSKNGMDIGSAWGTFEANPQAEKKVSSAASSAMGSAFNVDMRVPAKQAVSKVSAPLAQAATPKAKTKTATKTAKKPAKAKPTAKYEAKKAAPAKAAAKAKTPQKVQQKAVGSSKSSASFANPKPASSQQAKTAAVPSAVAGSPSAPASKPSAPVYASSSASLAGSALSSNLASFSKSAETQPVTPSYANGKTAVQSQPVIQAQVRIPETTK